MPKKIREWHLYAWIARTHVYDTHSKNAHRFDEEVQPITGPAVAFVETGKIVELWALLII